MKKDTSENADVKRSGGDMNVYEIGYFIVSSIPDEKVEKEVESIKGILSKNGAVLIAEEAPSMRPLAYMMTKKIGATNHRFTEGYFGWFKFEISKDSVEALKKSVEEHPSILRMLMISTIKENTYLGKISPVAKVESSEVINPEVIADQVAPIASIEEMDKSIDEMVKEA
jgi:ribosomal protein S6